MTVARLQTSRLDTVKLPTASRAHELRAAYNAAGMTLLELILVMLILSTVLAMAAPSLRGFFTSRRIDDAAAQILALTQFARSQADQRGDRLPAQLRHPGSHLLADGPEGGRLRAARDRVRAGLHAAEGYRAGVAGHRAEGQGRVPGVHAARHDDRRHDPAHRPVRADPGGDLSQRDRILFHRGTRADEWPICGKIRKTEDSLTDDEQMSMP